MIKHFRKAELPPPISHSTVGDLKINVVVRKRPVNDREVAEKDYDSVTCSNPLVVVHACKLKVDGISKYLDNTNFEFDHAFAEDASNETVFSNTAKPLIDFAISGGRATCFAYGQTGSGKTYTMVGIQELAAKEVFKRVKSSAHKKKAISVYFSFFELYGGRCIDLAEDQKKVCRVQEDGRGNVHVEGLCEMRVESERELVEWMREANRARTTHQTEMNRDSSRSHAICQITFRSGGSFSKLNTHRSNAADGRYLGKLSLIDLAGSERGQDTKNHNRQRRMESAEINKSLLALKECIRAIGSRNSAATHVPYRASKLTMVLKDSFSSDAKVVMISCISPVASSSDHTNNTLRYADRIKEKRVGKGAAALRERNGNRSVPSRSQPQLTKEAFADKGEEAASPPASPVAEELKSINEKARQGKITLAQKGRLKDNVLRRAISSEGGKSSSNDGSVDDSDEGVSSSGGGPRAGKPRKTWAKPKRHSTTSSTSSTSVTPLRRKLGQASRVSTTTPAKLPYGKLQAKATRVAVSRDAKGVTPPLLRRATSDMFRNETDEPSPRKNSAERRLRSKVSSGEFRKARRDFLRSAGDLDASPSPEPPSLSSGDSCSSPHPEEDENNGNAVWVMSAEEMNAPPASKQANKSRRARKPARGSGRSRPAFSSKKTSPKEDKTSPSSQRRHSRGSSKLGASPNLKDIAQLHNSLRRNGSLGADDDVADLHNLVTELMDEEEELLSKHMASIQRSADQLTEEGLLLSKVQGEGVVDYDIDGYAKRMDELIEEKLEMYTDLQALVRRFRKHLEMEELASKKVNRMPQY